MKVIVVALSILLAALSLPIAINHHLRNVYRQTLAHWLSKISPPPTVFIGDSIMTGGTYFDDIRNINLAANSLTTDQIAMRLRAAKEYRPRRIVIMAGMNDAIRGFSPNKIRALWEMICREPTIVVTLVSPSTEDDLNRRIGQINGIASESCRDRRVVTIDVGDENGRLRPEFAIDNIHLSQSGYDRWISALRDDP